MLGALLSTTTVHGENYWQNQRYTSEEKYSEICFPESNEPNLFWRVLTGAAYKHGRRYLRPFLRRNYDNFFQNSLNPGLAPREYAELFERYPARERFVLSQRPLLKLWNIELTEDLRLRAKTKKYLVAKPFPFYIHKTYFKAVFRTRFRFQASFGVKTFVRSLGLKAVQSFIASKSRIDIYVNFKYRFKKNTWVLNLGIKFL